MTSSSSGHSSDDRWYELLETNDYETNTPKTITNYEMNTPKSTTNYDINTANKINSTPPPLPARINGYQVTSKRNIDSIPHSLSQMQISQNHIHEHMIHNKIQVSHSLPLPHANFSLPLNSHNYSDYEHIGEKVVNKTNDNRPLPRTANIEYLVTRTPKIEYETKNNNNNNPLIINDGHSTDTSSVSDKGPSVPSEDELSTGSGNVSPRLRRSSKQRGGQLTPSSSNSRNHSPRPINGEARLRPGVTPRSNRNSANLSSSTLQEDLMKLINPDYMTEDPEQTYNEKKDINNSMIQSSNQEVIFTMARPATVISNASTASSPAPSEFKLTKEERLSPRVTNNGNNNNNNSKMNSVPEPLPLPDAGDMDWPSLVDTATRAMLQVTETIENSFSGSMQHSGQWDLNDVDDRLGIDSSITSS